MTDIKEALHQFIDQRGNVSVCEINREFGTGEYLLEFTDGGFVYGFNMSHEVASALIELKRERRLYVSPAHALTYLVDGCWCDLPMVVNPPKNGYKKPHWLPVVWNSYRHVKHPGEIVNGFGSLQGVPK